MMCSSICTLVRLISKKPDVEPCDLYFLGVGDQSQASHWRGELCHMYEDGLDSSLCREIGCYGWSVSDCEGKGQASCHGMNNIISGFLIFKETKLLIFVFSAAGIL